MSTATKTQIHDLPVAGPKPTHEEPNQVKLADLPEAEQIKYLQSQLELARAANRRPEPGALDFEARTRLFNEHKAAEAELHEMRKAVAADDARMNAAERYWEKQEEMCKVQGIPFDPEAFGIKRYMGNADLKRRFHEKHYEIAELEKRLGIRQPEEKPVLIGRYV